MNINWGDPNQTSSLPLNTELPPKSEGTDTK